MSALPKKEGYLEYTKKVKCYRWFCKRKPVFKKMIIKFPLLIRYVPACEKHK